MSRARHQCDERLERLWWLAPGTLYALVIGASLSVAAWLSDSADRRDGSRQFLAPTHLLLAAVAIAAFAVGSRLAVVAFPKAKMAPSDFDRQLQPFFWGSFGLASFGYVAWLGVGLRNGFTLGTLHELLTTNDPLLGET